MLSRHDLQARRPARRRQGRRRPPPAVAFQLGASLQRVARACRQVNKQEDRSMDRSVKMSRQAFEEARQRIDGVIASARDAYEEGDPEDAEATIMEAVWALENFADEVGGRPPRPRGGLFDD